MKVVINLKCLLLIVASALAVNKAISQEPSIVSDSIFSSVLHEQREVKIWLPEEYKPGSGVRYDVIYITDGETHLEDFSFISRFAGREQLVPPLILVAIPNTYTIEGNMRDRDFLPEKTADNIRGGGADNFIAFLKNELMPYIDTRYPTSGNNSLYGHSLGGLFTMYVLLKEPGLFSDYYCSDPAFPWNNMRIITMAEEDFRNTRELDKTLWIVGTEATFRNVGIAKMDSVLKACAPSGLRWKVSVYKNETHMSVSLKGIYDGLKYSFDGYNSKKQVEFHPMNGSLLEGIPMPIFLNGSFPNVYYTTDGSEPDTSSELAPQMIEIKGPAIVTVKWIGENKKYITSAKGNFELSPVWPSFQNDEQMNPGGLRYSYYEGKWESLPDFNNLKAIRTGIADDSFSLEKLPAKSNFGCVFEGYIKIEADGYYGFAISSSDGSRFYINEREIINNDGLHGSTWYKSYGVPLQKGFYPVRIEYFEGEGSRHLHMLYISPDAHETVNLTFKMMYYK